MISRSFGLRGEGGEASAVHHSQLLFGNGVDDVLAI